MTGLQFYSKFWGILKYRGKFQKNPFLNAFEDAKSESEVSLSPKTLVRKL